MQRFEVTKLGKAGRSAIGYPNFLFARLISNWHFWDNACENILYSIIKG